MFWRLTLREIGVILDGENGRLKREHNDRAWIAWHVAALMRAKKMPKLKQLLHGEKPTRAQTVDEMIAIARQWHAAINRKR